MSPSVLLALAIIVTPLSAQTSSLRDLERTCFRVTDNPTTENVALLQPLIASETGRAWPS